MRIKLLIRFILVLAELPLIQITAQYTGDTFATARIPISDKKSLSEFPLPIFRENLKNDSLDIRISNSEIERFQMMYPRMKLLPASPQLDTSDMATSLAEALTFTKYPTYEQYVSMMHYFAESYPSICRLDTFGYSVEGRLLLAVKISDDVHSFEDEPAFLYSSTIHGNELIGYILTLRLIDFILSSYGTNSEIKHLVDDLEIWINPLSNPDGTYHSGNQTVAGSIRYNSKAYDLNRNYPDPTVGDEDDTTGVQKENIAMMLFMRDKRFNLSANIHAGAEVVNYPWDRHHTRHPDSDWFVLISQEYADEARSINPSYFDNFMDDSTGIIGITNGADWYVIFGGRQDYVTYYLKGREVTLELCNTKYLESGQLETYWNYNKWSLINFISQARYGIHGNVKNKNTGKAIKAKLWVKEHDNDSTWIESDSITGNFYRYLKEGTYTLLISSEGYITDTIENIEVFDYQKTDLIVDLDSIGTKTDSSGTVSDTLLISNSKISTSGLYLYPNPTRDRVFISNHKAFAHDMNVEVYNAVGSMVYEDSWSKTEKFYEINVTRFNAGYYLIRISNDTERHTLRFIVE